MIARAKHDALRSAVLDEYLERRVYVERSLRQMVRAGQRWAMVPALLAPPDLGLIIRWLDAPPMCGVVLHEEGVSWVCLAPYEPGHRPCGAHAWPDVEQRAAALDALLEQVDPIRRIERRVAAALGETSDHPLVAAFAADMPMA